MRYVLGIDIGTTSIKGAVVGEDGKIYGSQASEYTLITLPAGEVEQSIEVYERAFRDAIAGAIAAAAVQPAEITCMGLSATGETEVFLDKNGRSLRNVMAWMDTRAIQEAEYLTSLFSRDELLRRTGAPAIRPSYLAARILWVREHEPEIFRNTKKIVLIKDYFIHKLFGEYISDDSLMCDVGYWEIPTRDYWDEMLAILGISRKQLPEVREPGEELGTITAAAAQEYGLDPHMKINLGGMDQACGAIGAGNIEPGIISESTGSAMVAVFICNKFQYDPSGAIPMFCAGLPQQYMFQPFSTGAIIMKWYRDQFCDAEKAAALAAGCSAYTLIDDAVARVPAGSDGLILLPYFQGAGSPEINKKAKGVYYGLTSAHTKAHFGRAIMEGVAMALRRMVDAAEPLCSKALEIRSLGGGAKSGIWCQIKADVLGLPVKVLAESESTPCIGAAILAGAATGIWPNVKYAVDQFTTIAKTYVPNLKNLEIYDQSYAKYLEISRALDSTFV